MAAGLQGYLDELRAALHPALCLHDFPSETVERHTKPIVEIAEPGSILVLPPVTVARSAQVRTHGGGCLLLAAPQPHHAFKRPNMHSARPSIPRHPSLQEHALIEQSVNSTRVSLKFKAADALEEHLLHTFLRFMTHR